MIETRSGDRVYPTVVWVVVDGPEVFLRSVDGAEGRWYRRAVADAEVTLVVGSTRLDARAVPATDPASVERASAGYRRKYATGPSLDAMLAEAVLDTTLRLEPR